MVEYHDFLRHILKKGVRKDDRTGTGTISIFGYQMRFDLAKGFPLLTTKKVFIKGIIHELLWFISGDTNIRYLVRNGVNIWNEWPFQNYLIQNDLVGKFEKHSIVWKEKRKWFVGRVLEDEEFANKWGELGPVYGYQWRNFNGVDQLSEILENIKRNPNSRRHIISAWNPSDIEDMAKAGLPPCHTLFQFYVAEGKLSCQLYQRSADVFLGVPFNIASYALLTYMVAQVCHLEVGDFVHTFGDAHIYLNHLNQVNLQLGRPCKGLPILELNSEIESLFNFQFKDVQLSNYDPFPPIRARIAV